MSFNERICGILRLVPANPARVSRSRSGISSAVPLRDWLKENLTPEIMGEIKVGRNAYMPKERLVDWQKRLAKKGWLCTGWPKEFGGPGFSTTQKYIFEMEMAKAGAPGTSPFGPKMCAPVIMKYGSAEQKARHLPPMLNSDLIWCQGYSEPGSGSDLASPAHQGGARGRPLHRERPEDLDDAGADRRLDLLPGAHLERGQARRRASPSC